jgi:hypothetical protein
MSGTEVNDADDFRASTALEEEEEGNLQKIPCYMIDPASPITVTWDIFANLLRLMSMLMTPFFFVFD